MREIMVQGNSKELVLSAINDMEFIENVVLNS